MSLEVLQIHRAAILITSPTAQPHTVDVDEETLVMIRLENPGNGADTYLLSHEINIDENISEDPGVTVSFSNDVVNIYLYPRIIITQTALKLPKSVFFHHFMC